MGRSGHTGCTFLHGQQSTRTKQPLSSSLGIFTPQMPQFMSLPTPNTGQFHAFLLPTPPLRSMIYISTFNNHMGFNNLERP